MARALQVRLTGRAARFLKLLQDFGHIDQQSADELLVAAAEMYGAARPARVDLVDIRRIAASWLIDMDLPADRRQMLEEDWSILFS